MGLELKNHIFLEVQIKRSWNSFSAYIFYFKEPKIDDVSLQNAINNIKALIKSNENSSDYHFHKAISKFLNNNDPRFEDTKDSDLQYFTKENILSFIRKGLLMQIILSLSLLETQIFRQ